MPAQIGQASTNSSLQRTRCLAAVPWWGCERPSKPSLSCLQGWQGVAQPSSAYVHQKDLQTAEREVQQPAHQPSAVRRLDLDMAGRVRPYARCRTASRRLRSCLAGVARCDAQVHPTLGPAVRMAVVSRRAACTWQAATQSHKALACLPEASQKALALLLCCRILQNTPCIQVSAVQAG